MTPLAPDEKERLIEEFRACLDEMAAPPGEDGAAPIDLHTLLAEMAALKNEVRLESRQFKGAVDELRRLGDALNQDNERLRQELERSRHQAADAQRQAERKLLLGVLDLRDRLQAGVDLAAARRPSALLRWLPREERFARGLAEGLALTLKRLDDLLDVHRVRPVPAVGLPLDPRHMQAIAVEAHADRPDGIVLREARRGFFHDGELLRAADVIVNGKAKQS